MLFYYYYYFIIILIILVIRTTIILSPPCLSYFAFTFSFCPSLLLSLLLPFLPPSCLISSFYDPPFMTLFQTDTVPLSHILIRSIIQRFHSSSVQSSSQLYRYLSDLSVVRISTRTDFLFRKSSTISSTSSKPTTATIISYFAKPSALALRPSTVTGAYPDQRGWMETYHGHVRTPADAIILFEACRIGLLPRVQRRLSEKERQSIQSGSVFVWDEREAGMRRWTDGKSWSASRVSGSFLTYREMEGKRGGTVTQPLRAGKTPDSRGSDDDRGDGADDGPDGYRYKPDGLMKQSFSITTSTGQHLHLISYYSRSHPAAATLQQPSTDPALRHVRPQKGLYPESTVNDQQNLPVVTRGPMAGAAYSVPHPMSAYVRAGATHPQSYTPPYAWPPTPLGTPPTITLPYGASYLSAVPTPNGPAIAYGQPLPHHHPALPPPPPQHGLPPPYDRPIHPAHPAESPLPPAIPPPTAQHTPLPALTGRSPRLAPDARDNHQRSPRDYPTPSVDPRIPSPRMHAPPSASHSNGVGPAMRSPRIISQAPPTTLPQVAPPLLNGTFRPADSNSNGTASTSATTVPSIGALMNGASGPLSSITPAPSNKLNAPRLGGSPRAEGPKDIPSEKIGFGGEDMRALRQLDRVFTA